MATYPFDINRLIDICRKNDVSMIGIFGSMARGETTEKSDVDLLVRFGKKKSLLALVRLDRELSTALGRKVDLLTESAISPYLRDRILGELAEKTNPTPGPDQKWSSFLSLSFYNPLIILRRV